MHERPADPVQIGERIPVIDLGKAMGEERPVVVQELMKAFEEYGFFQVYYLCIINTTLHLLRAYT